MTVGVSPKIGILWKSSLLFIIELKNYEYSVFIAPTVKCFSPFVLMVMAYIRVKYSDFKIFSFF